MTAKARHPPAGGTQPPFIAGNLKSDSDIMIDQIRTIHNRRLTAKVGEITLDLQLKVEENIKIVLDLD